MLAGFVLISVTDFLIHGFWLAADYEATKSLWRPESEMHSRFSLMLFAQLLCAATFVFIWAKGFAGQGIGTGIGIGLLMGLFQQIWAIIDYVVIPMPGNLAAKWFFRSSRMANTATCASAMRSRSRKSGSNPVAL